MSYSLQDFCGDVRTIMRKRDDHEAREQIRQHLERLLRDSDFRAAHLADDAAAGVRQIHTDPEFGFCVLAYSMNAPRRSPPHDHGDSWAVYGQVAGCTDMTVWQAGNGNVSPVRSFRLEPGTAGLFDVGEIHSIEYTEGAKFVRVTGVDLSLVSRRVFDPETGAVREVDDVRTRSARQQT